MNAGTSPTTAPAQEEVPTREQLRMAFNNQWRQGWPATLDEALAGDTLRDYARRSCIVGAARNLNRRATAGLVAHSLPKLPAPPVQPPPAPTGARKYGRSEHSIAKGPSTALTMFARPNPLGMLARPGTKATTNRFDARKAAANDLDD
jgi:hypothetical protein